MDRKEMEARAKALGIKFDDDTKDEDLQKLISTKEEGDKNSKDPAYLLSELQKVIKQRDRAKTERNTTTKKLAEMKEEMENMVTGETVDDLQKQLDELKSFKDDVAKKEEEDELSKIKDKDERVKMEFKKITDSLEEKMKNMQEGFDLKLQEKDDKLSENAKNVEVLRGHRLKAEIIDSAAKNKALGPSLIYKMLKDDFTYEPSLDKFVHKVKDKEGNLEDEKEVDEYIHDFLEKEENDYLVKADSNSKSMHTKKTTTPSRTPASGEYDPNDPDLIAKADLERMPVEDYIEVLEMKDSKMGLVQKAKEKES